MEYTVGRFVGEIHRHTRAFMAERMAPYGLPGPAVPLLMHLLSGAAPSQDDICRRGALDKTMVSRLLGTLEEHGLVVRVEDEHDSRAKRVEPTEKARELEPVIRGWLQEWNEVLTDGLTDEESRTALQLLERMAANARRRAGPRGGAPEPGNQHPPGAPDRGMDTSSSSVV